MSTRLLNEIGLLKRLHYLVSLCLSPSPFSVEFNYVMERMRVGVGGWEGVGEAYLRFACRTC